MDLSVKVQSLCSLFHPALHLLGVSVSPSPALGVPLVDGEGIVYFVNLLITGKIGFVMFMYAQISVSAFISWTAPPFLLFKRSLTKQIKSKNPLLVCSQLVYTVCNILIGVVGRHYSVPRSHKPKHLGYTDLI